MQTPGIEYTRQTNDPRVLVADGWGISIRVQHGQLVIADGVGPYRRERQLAKVEREVKRIVVLNARGYVTFDAMRWCRSVGIELVATDRDGNVQHGTWPENSDLTLVAAQHALATRLLDGPKLAVLTGIIGAKIRGQADNLRAMGAHRNAHMLDASVGQLASVKTMHDLMGVEGSASRNYWQVWRANVQLRWVASDVRKVPAHWLTYSGRDSLVRSGARNASDPVNAMLNYSYKLAEIETMLACHAARLDPRVGIMHSIRPSTQENRASLVYDLLETARPIVDSTIIQLIGRREFHKNDFVEADDGTVRILPPLTHELVELSIQSAPTLTEQASRLSRALLDLEPVGTPALSERTPKHVVKRVPQEMGDVMPDELWSELLAIMGNTQYNRRKRPSLAGIVLREYFNVRGYASPSWVPTRGSLSRRLKQLRDDGEWAAMEPLITLQLKRQGMIE